jgi:putative FmdB family regulatory protein
MPIYEYECSACSHRFEEWQKMSDKPIKVCPKCKARKVQKLISQTSFQLKGGGWYGDLYASKRPGDSGSSKSSGDAKASSSSDGESSKPAASSAEGAGKAKGGDKKKKTAAA